MNNMKTQTEPNPESPDAIESKLIKLGEMILTEPTERLAHRDQDQLPEWRGADVRVTSDFAFEPKDFMEGHNLLVRTQHAKALTWLIFELRDAFAGWLDYGNKCGFFGALAQAALNHLAAHQPESDDAKPLLRAVLAEAFQSWEALRQYGNLPPDAAVVFHQRDSEGRQSRTNLEDGKSCS